MGGPRANKRPTWNWKKRKQLGLDKPHVDMAEVLRKGSQNVRTSEEFLEFLKTQEGTLIEVGDGNFEMSEEMMKDKMDALNSKKMLQPTMLFGPHKNRGYIYPRKTKERKKIKHFEWLAKNRYGYV